MNNGVVIHLDNDRKQVLEPSKALFDQLGINLDYIICDTQEAFLKDIENHKHNVKALIFDLLSQKPDSDEINKKDALFLKTVQSSFANYSIPIFIYSGYLEAVEDEFINYGTVYKVDKDQGIDGIFGKIKLLLDSGFIDLFCPGGILETEVKEQLHSSFVNQFTQNAQIEEVLSSISGAVQEPEKLVGRVQKVFKRIAIKSLSSDLLAPVADGEDKVHPIEHFYKRQSKLEIWTGDIWKDKKSDLHVIVLTPRCDFATGKAESIIFININDLPKSISLKGDAAEIEKRMRDYLTDNLQGKSTRYIPSTTFFSKGGMASMNEHFTMAKKQFLEKFSYVVTLSDDLTNEIIGKFAYYFLRTGITNIDEKEFEAIVKSLNTVEENAPK